MVNPKRFDVVLVNLDPTVGSEIKKVRPCVVISPDSMNDSRLRTIIVAPMTSTIRPNFPTRVKLKFSGKKGQIAVDQIRAIDKTRIVKKLGKIQETTCNKVTNILTELFSE